MPDELDKILESIKIPPGQMSKTTPTYLKYKAQLNAHYLAQALDLIDSCEIPAKNFVAISKYKDELRAAFQAKYGGENEEA